MNAIELFSIPFAFFIVIFTILVIQSIVVERVRTNIGNIYLTHLFLFKAMNWWAVFIHELSHAITALATFNKIEEFKVSSEGGHVIHSNKNFGFFQWLSSQFISVSPAFIPPFIVALYLIYLGYINLKFNFNSFEPIFIISSLFLELIPYIVKTIGFLLISLDYSKLENILLLFIMIFSFSAAKPSSINEKGVEGDFQLLIKGFVKFPIFTLLSVLVFIALFWLLLKLNQEIFFYVIVFLILLPILSLFALVCNYLFIEFVILLDKSSFINIVISFLAFIFVYFYLGQFLEKQELINLVSFVAMVGILKLAIWKI